MRGPLPRFSQLTSEDIWRGQLSFILPKIVTLQSQATGPGCNEVLRSPN